MNSRFQPIFIIVTTTLFSVRSVIYQKQPDCNIGRSSCDLCHAYPSCYWCQSRPLGQQCRPFSSEDLSELECPGHWKDKTCKNDEQTEKAKLERIYNILLELKKRGKTESKPASIYDTNTREEGLLENGNGGRSSLQDNQRLQHERAETSNVLQEPDNYLRRARLMKALKLLKLIEVLQGKEKSRYREGIGSTRSRENNRESSGLNGAAERQLKELLRASGRVQSLKKYGRSGQNHGASSQVTDHDLDELIQGVGGKTSGASPVHNFKVKKNRLIPTPTTKGKVPKKTRTPTKSSSVVVGATDAKHFTKAVLSVSQKAQYLEEGPVHSSTRTVPTQTTTESIPVGCALLDDEDDCNNNSSCSWCNLMDICMNRNEDDMQVCYRQSKRDAIGKYVTDRCLKHMECEGCVKDGKCFWCEKTKSCHVYPFFGFVPHNCPANKWYYKDCDVQLAIFIILFPLLIILIAMIIFYFCLRYCYYRKRTLKVPLFEKPGLIEKKKGKKIYFMSGEDDDDEYRTEQIRKKYKLPVEKEPLIAP